MDLIKNLTSGIIIQSHATKSKMHSYHIFHCIKIKLFLYRPWRPLGLPEVEAPTFSDIWHTDGGKIVSPARRSLLNPRKIPGTYFC
jgi:hypothetical protein